MIITDQCRYNKRTEAEIPYPNKSPTRIHSAQSNISGLGIDC